MRATEREVHNFLLKQGLQRNDNHGSQWESLFYIKHESKARLVYLFGHDRPIDIFSNLKTSFKHRHLELAQHLGFSLNSLFSFSQFFIIADQKYQHNPNHTDAGVEIFGVGT